MHPLNPKNTGFKRQVVFRIDADDWPLLQQAASEHGSIQAAVLAGLHTITAQAAEPSAPEPDSEAAPDGDPKPPAATQPGDGLDPEEEIPAREAAALLGLKRNTVAGYIRSGRLPGRYDGEPTWRGWLSTRAAVEAYQKRRAAIQ